MKKYIGIPFKDGEPSFTGANCITLCELFYYNELKISIPKIRVESSNTKRVFLEYLHQISNNWTKVEEPKLYDIVAMSRDLKHPNMVQHFGIYLGNGKILHSLEKVGSHVVSIVEMKVFIKGFYRWH